MRPPWPFRRGEHHDPPSTGHAAPSTPPATVQRSEWTQLAPLDGLVRAPDLTAPSRPFVAGLSGRQSPDPIIQSLGHHRDPLGPAGLVTGIAVPRPLAPPETPLVLPPPVQRALDGPHHDVGPDHDVSPMGASTVAVVAEPVPAALSPAPPIQRLPAIDITLTPARSLLTRAPESGGGPQAPATPRGLVAQRAPDPAASRGVVVQRSPEPAASVQSVAGPAPAAPPRLTLGESRRLGLGPPLQRAALPDSAAAVPPLPLQPSTVAGTPPTGSIAPAMAPQQLRPIVPPDVPTPAVRPTAGLGAPLASGPGTLARPVARTPLTLRHSPEPSESHDASEPLQRMTDVSGASGETVAAGPQALAVAAPAVQRSLEVVRARFDRPEPSDHALAPIVGRGPRAETGTHAARSISPPPVQRAAAGGMPTIHRGDDAAREAKSFGARAFTREAHVYIPATHGPLDRGPGAALLAHELTHVRQQRQLGDGLPAESTDAGQRLEAEARAAEHSYELPSPMALPSARRTEASESAPVGTTPAAAASAPAESSHGAGNTTGSAAIMPLRATQRADGSPASAGPAPARPEEDLDDLARRLYGRLRDRLHRELLVDRERSGMVTDLR